MSPIRTLIFPSLRVCCTLGKITPNGPFKKNQDVFVDPAKRKTSANPLKRSLFDQEPDVKSLRLPHVSLMETFDPGPRTVTLLAIDILTVTFYRISFDRFCEGLSDGYTILSRKHGYGKGRYTDIGLCVATTNGFKGEP